MLGRQHHNSSAWQRHPSPTPRDSPALIQPQDTLMETPALGGQLQPPRAQHWASGVPRHSSILSMPSLFPPQHGQPPGSLSICRLLRSIQLSDTGDSFATQKGVFHSLSDDAPELQDLPSHGAPHAIPGPLRRGKRLCRRGRCGQAEAIQQLCTDTSVSLLQAANAILTALGSRRATVAKEHS